MKDIATKQPLLVLTDGGVGPYINVPVAQLDAILRLLEQRGVPHTVDEFFISLNDVPEEATVNLGRGEDSMRVQKILDSVD